MDKRLIGKILPIILVVVGLAILMFFSKKESTQQEVGKKTATLISGTFDKSKSKTNEEWKKILTPQQYDILINKGTEIPYTGTLLHEKRKGTYYSVGCDLPLFRSESKFDSGTGWPSFWEPITKDAVVLSFDKTLGTERVEVLDPCGGHLGHVFDDGPQPTGKRYCINSVALYFVPDKK